MKPYKDTLQAHRKALERFIEAKGYFMRYRGFTPVEEEIITALRDNGGEYPSLFSLTIDHCLNYSHAHHCVRKLSGQGWITAKRQGRRLVLRLASTKKVC